MDRRTKRKTMTYSWLVYIAASRVCQLQHSYKVQLRGTNYTTSSNNTARSTGCQKTGGQACLNPKHLRDDDMQAHNLHQQIQYG